MLELKMTETTTGGQRVAFSYVAQGCVERCTASHGPVGRHRRASARARGGRGMQGQEHEHGCLALQWIKVCTWIGTDRSRRRGSACLSLLRPAKVNAGMEGEL